ncbi:maleylacetoacetate isomerase [Stenotrophomonas sp. MMGLT7]|uniref:maleylacetoacetate isomerase n=1 Tax=Stenotrophomonas sp. MMGLT7 TaxID=2901227 RepID=UPI001E47EA9A|nr:maleylacetoacetate isomerase [Stenotrophomonas sp. MMGLT7]MCD7099183.1 maleylacetoacetate isomerase [Stenotrophomonas sp. MMGLT7]
MADERLRLYGYWRSSAAYRVRIGLALKSLEYEPVPVSLVHGGGEQRLPAYARVNPQQLVPVLRHEGQVVRQSLAILEYLDELWPAPPLLPPDAAGRARVRALAQLVACDIHPLNNLRVLRFLEERWDVPTPQRQAWIAHWIGIGLHAFEQLLADPHAGRFCHGDVPGLADCCLLPQLYNAHRFDVDLTPYPRIRRIEAHCLALPAFAAARPENQPDAPA